jgi:hypothetical protein
MRPCRMARFLRRSEAHSGVPGVAFRVPDNQHPRELEVELGAIATELDTQIGGTPDTLMGLPGSSDNEEANRRREWGIWAPDRLVGAFAEALVRHGHTVVDE